MTIASKAIIAVGIFAAALLSAAYMVTNRYQVAEPFDPQLFQRYDRWTSRAENCSSAYDGRTYCGEELMKRLQEMITADNEATDRKLNSLGYTQTQIDGWPQHVVEGARNMVRNNRTRNAVEMKEAVEEWLRKKGASAPAK